MYMPMFLLDSIPGGLKPRTGTYDGMVRIDDPLGQTISFVAAEVEQPNTIHIILEVRDRGEPALFSFQRILISVLP